VNLPRRLKYQSRDWRTDNLNNTSAQQGPKGQPQQQAAVKQSAEVGLSIEVVLLLVVGLFFFLLGLLLIGAFAGVLPYSEDSTAGFILVLVSLHTVTMGKTPLGDFRRSWFVVIIGLILGALGTLSIFFPGGALSGLVGILAALALAVGGTVLLVQLFTSEEKAKTWMKVGGILLQLTIALGVVYVLEIIAGVGSFVPVIKTNPLWALVVVIFGASFFYAARCVQKVNRQYRPEEAKTPGT
jgi:hypothetical protein